MRTGIPATSIYLDAPRPLRDYKLLAATGAKWLNLFDVTVRAHLAIGFPICTVACAPIFAIQFRIPTVHREFSSARAMLCAERSWEHGHRQEFRECLSSLRKLLPGFISRC